MVFLVIMKTPLSFDSRRKDKQILNDQKVSHGRSHYIPIN